MILLRLINKKRGISNALANHILYYPTPISINYSWSFGSLVGLFFGLQVLTGVFLAMHYTAHVEFAFQSVEHIMTDVHNGYLIRYMHANGASMIFILMYLHIARGLYFRSYLGKRRALWWSGIIIFLLMMATAFIGYVLPWGQMSFWGATVITSLVTAIPIVGENIAYWLWGGFSVSNATLIRFFSLHYLLPFIIIGIIFLHLILLHETGSTNPTQTTSSDKITFHPYFTVKDTFIFTIVLMIFIIIVSYYPNMLGHSDNFIPANPLITPAHIVPEWYFTPFYAILRSCPNKLGGVIGMLAAILVLFLLPYFQPTYHDVPATKSPLYKLLFGLFVLNFLILMFLGGQPAAAPFVLCSKFFTLTYFVYLLLAIPFINLVESYALHVIKNGEKKSKSVIEKITLSKIPNKLINKNKTKRKIRTIFGTKLALPARLEDRLVLKLRHWCRYKGYQKKSSLKPKLKQRIRRRKRICIYGKRYKLSVRRKPWWVNQLKGTRCDFKTVNSFFNFEILLESYKNYDAIMKGPYFYGVKARKQNLKGSERVLALASAKFAAWEARQLWTQADAAFTHAEMEVWANATEDAIQARDEADSQETKLAEACVEKEKRAETLIITTKVVENNAEKARDDVAKLKKAREELINEITKDWT